MLVTAEKFCAREGIHKSMIEQITKFLRQQTGAEGQNNKPVILESQGGTPEF